MEQVVLKEAPAGSVLHSMTCEGVVAIGRDQVDSVAGAIDAVWVT